MKEYSLIDSSEVILNGVPCIYIKPNFINGDLPTVLLYHGWSSNKENFKFIGTVLAQNGFQVIVPDAVDHGVRASLDYENILIMKENFWRVVFETVNESKGLIDEAVKVLGINENKIAVMGSSMGGFICSGIFTRNKNVKCIINMNGASAWENSEYHFRRLHNLNFATEEQMAYIKENDPLRFKGTFNPRGILLLHGDSDTQVSIETQRYFYNEVKGTYMDSNNLQLIESPGLDHYKTVRMLEESIDWLNRFI